MGARALAAKLPACEQEVLALRRDCSVPMHRQIATQLRQAISSGRYALGDRIPTEPEISRQFGVSRITARQAVEHLVRDGLVLRKQGKGTFVRQPVVRHDLLELRGIYDELVEQGLDPETELLEYRQGPAPARVAGMLDASGTLVHWKRLYRLNGRPFGLSSVYMDPDGAAVERALVARRPTYDVLRSVLKLKIDRADVVIRYETGRPGVCRRMELPSGTPLMVLERVSYTADGRAREHTLYYAEASSYQFSVKVRGPLDLVSNLKQAV